MRTTAQSANQPIISSRFLPFPLSSLLRPPLPEFLIIGLAALLRFWRLGYHSVWFDEAVSLRWGVLESITYMWPVTFRLVEEKHPPVYYTLLKLWHYLLTPLGLGMNDAALRGLGSLLGVLTVVGMLLLATRVSGRATGLLTALLVALSPVLVWYSQELRMFQPATTFLVWAAYFLLRAWQEAETRKRMAWWLGLILTLDLALYTYLFSAFMLPAAGLALAILWAFGGDFSVPKVRDDFAGDDFAGDDLHRARASRPEASITGTSPSARRRFMEGVGALALTTLLFLPLARNALNVNAAESTPGVAFANFVGNSRRVLKIFTIWRENWPDWVGEGAVWVLVILLLIGLAGAGSSTGAGIQEGEKERARKRANRDLGERVWLWVWIGGPLVVANLMLSRSHSIFKEERYLIFMTPFVLWAIARGVVVLGRRWRVAGWVTGTTVVIMLAALLPRLWTPDAYRENWRAAAEYITHYQQMSAGLADVGASGASVSDAVVAHISYTHQPLDWYLKQRYPQTELPVFGLFGNPLAAEQVETVVAPPLEGIPKELGASTLWLTQSHLEGVDDGRLVEAWLNAHYPLITEQFPTGVKLSGYALKSIYPALPPLADGARYPNAELAAGLTLAACEITTPVVSATDQELHPPSGWVHVRLWWQASDAIRTDYQATAQVVNAQGVWGQWLPRENSALQRFPSSRWRVGDFVREELDINLNPSAPAGEYTVVIGAQDEAGQLLEDTIPCGTVRILDNRPF